MKKILTLTLSIAMMAILFTSCSKEKTLSKRLEGTWTIDKIDGTITPAGGGAGTPISFTQAGTFTFKDDGTGSNSIVILGQTNNSTFNWTNTATTVTITESGQTPIVLTVTTNEKTKQVWTATETDANTTSTFTYTLTKK